jgi:hypothetical protein
MEFIEDKKLTSTELSINEESVAEIIKTNFHLLLSPTIQFMIEEMAPESLFRSDRDEGMSNPVAQASVDDLNFIECKDFTDDNMEGVLQISATIVVNGHAAGFSSNALCARDEDAFTPVIESDFAVEVDVSFIYVKGEKPKNFEVDAIRGLRAIPTET